MGVTARTSLGGEVAGEAPIQSRPSRKQGGTKVDSEPKRRKSAALGVSSVREEILQRELRRSEKDQGLLSAHQDPSWRGRQPSRNRSATAFKSFEASSMKLELLSASNFLVHLIRLGRRNVSESQLSKFRDCLIEIPRRRYRDHWFPEKPFKGSGYRCIRINGRMDPVIAQAGEACGLDPSVIHATFPSELTMWIDPLEVSYRIGENGSICVLYEYKENGPQEPWRPNQNANKTSSTSSNNDNEKHQQNIQQQNQQQQQQALNDNNCKETLRKMDYLLDPRRSVSIEQLAAYVSSS